MPSPLPDEVADELVAIALEGVESPSVRRMLEYLVRDGQLQRACWLKDMMQAAAEAMRDPAILSE